MLSKPAKHGGRGEGRLVVNRIEIERGRTHVQMKDVPYSGEEEACNHDSQPRCNRGIDAGRSFDAAKVERGEQCRKRSSHAT